MPFQEQSGSQASDGGHHAPRRKAAFQRDPTKTQSRPAFGRRLCLLLSGYCRPLRGIPDPRTLWRSSDARLRQLLPLPALALALTLGFDAAASWNLYSFMLKVNTLPRAGNSNKSCDLVSTAVANLTCRRCLVTAAFFAATAASRLLNLPRANIFCLAQCSFPQSRALVQIRCLTPAFSRACLTCKRAVPTEFFSQAIAKSAIIKTSWG